MVGKYDGDEKSDVNFRAQKGAKKPEVQGPIALAPTALQGRDKSPAPKPGASVAPSDDGETYTPHTD